MQDYVFVVLVTMDKTTMGCPFFDGRTQEFKGMMCYHPKFRTLYNVGAEKFTEKQRMDMTRWATLICLENFRVVNKSDAANFVTEVCQAPPVYDYLEDIVSFIRAMTSSIPLPSPITFILDEVM